MPSPSWLRRLQSASKHSQKQNTFPSCASSVFGYVPLCSLASFNLAYFVYHFLISSLYPLWFEKHVQTRIEMVRYCLIRHFLPDQFTVYQRLLCVPIHPKQTHHSKGRQQPMFIHTKLFSPPAAEEILCYSAHWMTQSHAIYLLHPITYPVLLLARVPKTSHRQKAFHDGASNVYPSIYPVVKSVVWS